MNEKKLDGWTKFEFVTHDFGTRFAQIKSCRSGECLTADGQKGDAFLHFKACDNGDIFQFWQIVDPFPENKTS